MQLRVVFVELEIEGIFGCRGRGALVMQVLVVLLLVQMLMLMQNVVRGECHKCVS